MDGLGRGDVLLFEGFRFDTRGGCLFRLVGSGVAEPVALGSRALELLGLLVRRKGELVSKDEIMKAIWAGRAVEEANLNVQIAKLRHVLDRNRQHGSCIQTVTGHGYRFSGEVTRLDPAAIPASLAALAFDSGDPGNEGKELRVSEAKCQATIGLRLPTIPVPRGVLGPLLTAVIGTLSLVGALIAVLEWPASGSRELRFTPPPLSIAVLAFCSLGDDSEQQSFADGITEDLTTDLARVEGMLVISRSAAFTDRNRPIDPRQIGRELGVRYLIKGSVQRLGSVIRVSAQLSSAENATIRWAERFEGDTGDLFALQNEITSRIAVALKLELIEAEVVRRTEHPDALDYILRGRAALLRPATGDQAQSTDFFERAVALDPQSVAALSWLARTLASRQPATMTDIARAKGLVAKALAASPRSALAHYAKGTIRRAESRFAEAIPEYETAIDLDRNWPDAYANLGQSRFYTGSIEEYVPLVEKAIRLSPHDPLIGVWFGRIGLAELLRSRVDEAIYWLEKARIANPELPYVYSRLASAHALKDETERAVGELAEGRRLSRDDRYSSIARMRTEYLGVPQIRARYETVYFAGLRLAGMPEQ